MIHVCITVIHVWITLIHVWITMIHVWITKIHMWITKIHTWIIYKSLSTENLLIWATRGSQRATHGSQSSTRGSLSWSTCGSLWARWGFRNWRATCGLQRAMCGSGFFTVWDVITRGKGSKWISSPSLYLKGGGSKIFPPAPCSFFGTFQKTAMQPMQSLRCKLLRITLKYKVITLSNILDNFKVAKY